MTEPITLAQAKANLRVSDSAEDDLISGLIVAAREHVEGETGLVLTRRQVVETRRMFGPWIDLYSWPIASIDSIAYLDGAFALQPLDASLWIAGTAMRPVRIVSRGNLWPTIASAPVAVTVTMTAGYATPDEVPMRLKQAMHLLVVHWFGNRSAVEAGVRAAALEIPLGVAGICDRWRLKGV